MVDAGSNIRAPKASRSLQQSIAAGFNLLFDERTVRFKIGKVSGAWSTVTHPPKFHWRTKLQQ